MSQLKGGAFVSYVTIFIVVATGLLVTPYTVSKLGEAEYGLYTLIGSFVAYIGIMDLGINNAIIRFVSKYRAEQNKSKEENFLATTLLIYTVIAMVVALIGALLTFNFDLLFQASLTEEELRKAKIMFKILILNLTISIPGGSFMAICHAYEKFIFSKTIYLFRHIIRAVLVVALLYFGGDAIGLVILETAISFSVIAIFAFYVIRNLHVKFRLTSFDWKLVGEIFAYSIWIFVYSIVYKMQWNGGQIILGMNTNTVIVGIYGIGVMLGGYYGTFADAINNMLVPRATKMVVQNKNGHELTSAMVQIGRINVYILFVILTGFTLFGRKFIDLWVGSAYKLSWDVALLIMIAMTVPLTQAFGNSILEAKKKNRFKAVVSLASVGLAFVAGFYLSKRYGLYGIIVPLAIALLANTIIMNIYFKKIFDFKVGSFFSRTLLKPTIVYAALIVVSWGVLRYIPATGWLTLLIQFLVYLAVYCAITYFFLMNLDEKRTLKIKKN